MKSPISRVRFRSFFLFPFSIFLLILLLAGSATVWGQVQEADPFTRYKVPLDLRRYPQSAPEKALASVVQTINEGNFDYLMAQLADPDYVDGRVAEYKKGLTGPDEARDLVAFDKLAKEVRRHFQQDPTLAQELRRLAKEGKVDFPNKTAFIHLPNITSHGAMFKSIKGRWYLQNSRHPKK